MDSSFSTDAVPNDAVSDLAIQSNGKMVVAGNFTAIGTASRSRIARLNADGAVDATFDPGTGPDSTVNRVALQTD